MSCRLTLSQVSSSAALSHSKAFQFMSSTEKQISFKDDEGRRVDNEQRHRLHVYHQQKRDPIIVHIFCFFTYEHSIKEQHWETVQLFHNT